MEIQCCLRDGSVQSRAVECNIEVDGSLNLVFTRYARPPVHESFERRQDSSSGSCAGRPIESLGTHELRESAYLY